MYYGALITSSVLVASIPVTIAYFLTKRYLNLKRQCKLAHKKDWKVIFTTYNSRKCKQHIYKQSPCGKTCSYTYLYMIVQFIETAKESVSLCMCLTTCTEIQDALIRAHNRGVNVRFITDIEMIGNAAARSSFLKEAEIPIKVQETHGTILHHKFCLADEKHVKGRKLFFGSLNLTCQGLTSNWDVIIFTSNAAIIQRFSEEFEYLWSNFKNH